VDIGTQVLRPVVDDLDKALEELDQIAAALFEISTQLHQMRARKQGDL
jgi:hypothetical protein